MAKSAKAHTHTGLVIKSTGSWYRLRDMDDGAEYEARIRGKFKIAGSRLTNPLAVGDRVEYQLEADDIAWITKIHPRQNYLIRKAVNLSREAHIIASNIDIACFLFSLKMPETSTGFLDRFLACCEAYSIHPLILFNKVDLLSAQELEIIQEISAVYEKIGYQTLQTSAESGLHLAELIDVLKDKTSVFFGHSGAGKSTLVNKIQPGLRLRTGELSEAHTKGKHTTTFAQMYSWDFGGSVIDTPGVREFAMVDVQASDIQHFFPEIFSTASGCKFHNCLHINEPHCKVLQAVDSGEILESRYLTYLKLMEEAEELQKFN